MMSFFGNVLFFCIYVLPFIAWGGAAGWALIEGLAGLVNGHLTWWLGAAIGGGLSFIPYNRSPLGRRYPDQVFSEAGMIWGSLLGVTTRLVFFMI